MKKIIKEYMVQSDIDFIEENAKKIAKQLGYNSVKYIGQGNFGLAYDVGDGKILKITTDKSEAANANRLRKKPITKHIINYYDVRAINNPRNRDYYSIVMDAVTPLNNQNYRLFYADIYRRFLDPNLSDKKVFDHVFEYLERYETEDYFDECLNFYKKKLAPQRQSILKEFKKYGIPTNDAHSSNVGFDDEGNFVYFDIGMDKMSREYGKSLKPITMKEGINIKKHIPIRRECKKCGKKTKQTHKETEKLHIYKCAQCNNVEWDKKNKKDMKTIKMTESDLTNIVKKIVKEASNPRIMRTVYPEIDRNPPMHVKRKLMAQHVLDRIMKYGPEYMDKLEELNSEFPIDPDKFKQYSYED